MKAPLQYMLFWLAIMLAFGAFLARGADEKKQPTVTRVSNFPVAYNCHMHATMKGKHFVPMLKVVFATTYVDGQTTSKTLALFDLYLFDHEKAERKGLTLCQKERKRQEKEKRKWAKKRD